MTGHMPTMRITLLLALLLAACAAPAPRDDAEPSHASGPTIRIGGGIGNYYGGNTR